MSDLFLLMVAPVHQAAAAAKLAAVTVALPPPRCRCLRRQRHALAKLPPPLPSWPPMLTLRSCQASAAAAKLAAAPALSPRFSRHCRPLRFNCYRRRCHRRRFCAFS